MRKFIDILKEAPISAFDWQAGDEYNDLSFSASDRKLLDNPKARDKIIKAFKKTPFNFEVIFRAGNFADADDHMDNEKVDTHAEKIKAGIHTKYKDVVGKPGVIKILILGNLSPTEAKMPMSAWTLAHKIGHAIQDSFPRSRYVEPMVAEVNRLINLIDSHESKYKHDPKLNYNFEYPAWISEFLTMKSARDEKLTNGFEVFAELIAQYLISGSITMNLKNEKAQQVVTRLNQEVHALLAMLEGKVLVET